jgi:hypothetical protein
MASRVAKKDGPGTRGGFVWENGQLHLCDHVEIVTEPRGDEAYHDRIEGVLRSPARTGSGGSAERHSASFRSATDARNRMASGSRHGSPRRTRDGPSSRVNSPDVRGTACRSTSTRSSTADPSGWPGSRGVDGGRLCSVPPHGRPRDRRGQHR